MSTGTAARRVVVGPGHDRALLVAGVVAALGLLAVGLHWLAAPALVTAPRYLLYPVVWAALAAYALVRVAPVLPTTRRGVAVALGAGLAYLGAFAWLTGTVGHGHGSGTLRLVAAPPGWGPLLVYDGAVSLSVVPFVAIGGVALAVLVGLVAARASRSLAVGVVGLAACVGCTVPLLGALVGLGVGSSTLVTAAVGVSYDLSTLVFVAATLALLPGAVGRQFDE